jgi:hypothetical protein
MHRYTVPIGNAKGSGGKPRFNKTRKIGKKESEEMRTGEKKKGKKACKKNTRHGEQT